MGSMLPWPEMNAKVDDLALQVLSENDQERGLTQIEVAQAITARSEFLCRYAMAWHSLQRLIDRGLACKAVGERKGRGRYAPVYYDLTDDGFSVAVNGAKVGVA